VRLTATAGGGVRVEVHVKPRATKSKVVGVHGEALSIAIAAPPVDGEANDEVVRFVAKLFGIPKQQVGLVRGAGSRQKLLELDGVSVEVARQVVAGALA
jgi:uncharacterized protein (TIGR00251 family)